MSVVDVQRLSTILRDAAKAEVLPRFRRLDDSMVKVKSEAIDIVTEADTSAERFIKAGVAELAPDALFVGEESVAADPALLDALPGAELAVVVDPIDGTANFAAGVPLFAVMAAVVSKGETVAGIIYDPMGDDWILAEKGSGAFLRRPDGGTVRLRVADPVPLAQMVGTASVAYMPAEAQLDVLSHFVKVRLVSNYRGAGHEYRLLASGFSQFAVFNKLMPWDHLAGALICEEAGAYVRRFDGSAYRPEHQGGGLLTATSKDAWEELRREVFTF